MYGRNILHAAVVTAFACGTLGTASAQTSAKPTDPQIAHIAYTAGNIDIANAKLALQSRRTRTSARSPTTWSATTRR